MGTMEQTNIFGTMGRTNALLFLQSQQYQYVNKNYHSRFGEIDLIVKRGNELVFVEVKAFRRQLCRACEVISVFHSNVRFIKTAQFFYKDIPIITI